MTNVGRSSKICLLYLCVTERTKKNYESEENVWSSEIYGGLGLSAVECRACTRVERGDRGAKKFGYDIIVVC